MGFGCSSESRMQVAINLYVESLHKGLDMTNFRNALVKEGVVGSDAAAQVFGDVFKNGVVTDGERMKLRLSGGLSTKDDAELGRLVGKDGANLLHWHAIWLADHAVKQTFRVDAPVESRVAMLLELSALYAMHPKSLKESSFNEVEPFLLSAFQDTDLQLAAIGVWGTMEEFGLKSLLLKLKDPQRHLRLYVVKVIGGMGRVALPMIPALKQVVRDDPDAEVRKAATLVKDHLESIGK